MRPISRILFPTENSSLSRAFAPQVFALAGRLGASVVLHPVSRGLEAHLRSGRFDLLTLPLPGRRPWCGLVPSPAAPYLRDAPCAVWTAAGSAAFAPLRVQHILCAVDLGPDTPRLLDTAAILARTFHAAVTLLHVLPPLDESLLHLAAGGDLPSFLLAEPAEERLHRHLRRRALAAAVVIERGDPAALIHRFARRLPAGLLLLGPGRTGLHRMQIVRQAPCPVLILDRPAPVALHCPS